jgi:hypothetical protein
MLDVHHKDGDRENGSIENLEVLCVWCHALYTRKILGPSPNWDGTSLARKNNVGSTPTGSTNSREAHIDEQSLDKRQVVSANLTSATNFNCGLYFW